MEYKKSGQYDVYSYENFENFQKQLYRYLLDYTKNKTRTEVLAKQ